MNLTEALERIAARDGELIQNLSTPIDGVVFKVNGEFYYLRHLQQTNKLWQLFGALCERIESRGFKWTFPNDGVTEKYVCELWPQNKVGADSICGYSNEHPAHAAALAYLEALESICDRCEGSGQEPCEEPGWEWKDVKCSLCQGTGKKLRVEV